MKTRYALVSNSSSSSFIINKIYLTPIQMAQIKNHIEVAKELGLYSYEYDAWAITEHDHHIHFSTNMDNFDMNEFLHKIGVDLGAKDNEV